VGDLLVGLVLGRDPHRASLFEHLLDLRDQGGHGGNWMVE